MIIVSVGAGLGNQMFELAYYLHLKNLYPECAIKLDTNYAFPYAHNGIEVLDIFDLEAEIATRDEVINMTKGFLGANTSRYKTMIGKILRHVNCYPSSMLVQRDYTEFYKKFLYLDKSKSYYMHGAFANYLYFRDIKDEVRKTYVFPEISDERNIKYAEMIKTTNSVSIHIRRGDYVSLGIELVPIEFYEKAISIIEEKAGKVVCYVFSDDIFFARKMFGNGEKYVFVEGNNGVNSFRDMQLMSYCKHNITTNSTFSFWGAFLNGNKSRIVVAPNIPYTGCKRLFICDDWVVL